MANIALRNPQFKFHQSNESATVKVQLLLLIGGTLRYTIEKFGEDGFTTNFDISELARDYLNISYSATDYSDSIVIQSKLQALNAAGALIGPVSTFNDIGLEAYGLFEELANPIVPFENIGTARWLLAENPSTGLFEIFTPFSQAGKVAYMESNGNIQTASYSTTATTIPLSQAGSTLKINRIDCTKYGIGNKLWFINKYGVQQELWFFLKTETNVNRTNENYKSNTLNNNDATGDDYSLTNAPRKLFNTQAKRTIKLSSGYYPEFAVEFFEQLLLSEYVWIEIRKTQQTTKVVLPFTVINSSIEKKTSVNNRLIEYTMEFEEAADYINNIR